MWIRIFPDKSYTKKPFETRMGKGKAPVEGWVAVVKPGRVLFEMAGISVDVAKEAMRLAVFKLPIHCRFVTKAELEGTVNIRTKRKTDEAVIEIEDATPFQDEVTSNAERQAGGDRDRIAEAPREEFRKEKDEGYKDNGPEGQDAFPSWSRWFWMNGPISIALAGIWSFDA